MKKDNVRNKVGNNTDLLIAEYIKKYTKKLGITNHKKIFVLYEYLSWHGLSPDSTMMKIIPKLIKQDYKRDIYEIADEELQEYLTLFRCGNIYQPPYVYFDMLEFYPMLIKENVDTYENMQ